MSYRLISAALLGAVLLPAPASAAQSQGETLFKQRCGTCHAVAPGGPAKLGPPLKGVMGAKAGTLPGPAASAAMKKSGIVWNAATMDAYLAKPTATVPGTKMLVGMPDAAQRKAVIAYLETLK